MAVKRRKEKPKRKHDYTKNSFWLDPINHFWETDMYTEKGKAYLRNFVKQL